MSSGWRIAILGAASPVGGALIELLAEASLSVAELYLLLDEGSDEEEQESKSVRFKGRTLSFIDANSFEWGQVDVAFFVTERVNTQLYVERATQEGCVIFDNSGLFALSPDVPLYMPGVNPEVLDEYRQRNIIALPQADTCQLLSVIYPLIERFGISKVQVTTFMPASTCGKQGVHELAGQSASLLNGMPVATDIFVKQLAFNILPILMHKEQPINHEYQLIEEVTKILHRTDLIMNADYLQVGVFYGQTQSIYLESEYSFDNIDWHTVYSPDSAIEISKKHDILNPVEHIAQDGLCTIAVKYVYGVPEAIRLYSVSDNIKFGSALMLLKALQHWVERG